MLQDGDTPLMRAVRNRFEMIVRLLLDKGAKVAVFDKVGIAITGLGSILIRSLQT